MNVVFALVGVTVVLLVVIVMVMLWAIRSGQFEDLEGPAWRVVMDDDRADTDCGQRADIARRSADADELADVGRSDDSHGIQRDDQAFKKHR